MRGEGALTAIRAYCDGAQVKGQSLPQPAPDVEEDAGRGQTVAAAAQQAAPAPVARQAPPVATAATVAPRRSASGGSVVLAMSTHTTTHNNQQYSVNSVGNGCTTATTIVV